MQPPVEVLATRKDKVDNSCGNTFHREDRKGDYRIFTVLTRELRTLIMNRVSGTTTELFAVRANRPDCAARHDAHRRFRSSSPAVDKFVADEASAME
jgi:hypothetical protein